MLLRGDGVRSDFGFLGKLVVFPDYSFEITRTGSPSLPGWGLNVVCGHTEPAPEDDTAHGDPPYHAPAVVRWSSSQQDLSVPFRSRPGLTGGFLLMAIIWRSDS